jgi:hypothetical protein
MKVNEAKKKCFLPVLRVHGSRNSWKFAEFADQNHSDNPFHRHPILMRPNEAR